MTPGAFLAWNHVEGRGAVGANVASATTLVATLLQCFSELGGKTRGESRAGGSARVLGEESGEGLACFLSSDASIMGKGGEEIIEGLHTVKVGGHFDWGAVLEIDKPIKSVSFLKIFQERELALKMLLVMLLTYLDRAKAGVGLASVVAVLMDACDDVTGGRVLQDEINSRGEGLSRIKEARFLRGEDLSVVIDRGGAQRAGVLLVVLAKRSLDLIATGSVVKLQPGCDAVASSVGVINKKTKISLLTRSVIDPAIAWAVAAIFELRGSHVSAVMRGRRWRAPGGLR